MKKINANQINTIPEYSMVFYCDVEQAKQQIENIWKAKLKIRGFEFVIPFNIIEVDWIKYKYLVFELRKDKE